MTILRILQYPDPRLNTPSIPVDNVKAPKVQQLIDDMLETLYKTENCAGLAATQLDVETAYRITVFDLSTNRDEPTVLVNPEIVESHGETDEAEGCMSVEGVYEKVKRAAKVKAKALDRDGNVLEINADGFLAKCIQHETDHLDGILYIDRMTKLKRKMVDKKVSKFKRRSR